MSDFDEIRTDGVSTGLTSFRYKSRINENQIRLLEPIRANSQTLAFRLITKERSKDLSHTAVSYAWGDGEATKTIRLNGRNFRVRPNLWFCLQHVSGKNSLRKGHEDSQLGRDRNGKTFGSALWVDAICINQDDPLEKNAQVGTMDITYQQASYVAVWLGLPRESSTPLTETKKKTAPQKQQGTGEEDEEDWAGWQMELTNLANRPYWTRYWVIQEFLLNPNVVIGCGQHFMTWENFKEYMYTWAGFSRYDARWFYDEKPAWGTTLFSPEIKESRKRLKAIERSSRSCAASHLVHAKNYHVAWEKRATLYQLLVRHHQAQCQDPRDKVFALLGLLEWRERRVIRRAFPNYTLSMDHVAIITLAHLQYIPPDRYSDRPRINLRERKTADKILSALGLDDLSRTKRQALIDVALDIDYNSLTLKGSRVHGSSADERERIDCQVQNLMEKGSSKNEGR